MSLLVVGSVAFDGLETPFGKVERTLGGAATYFSVAASFFTHVHLVGVVGDDFSDNDAAVFRGRRIDLRGLERAPGKTFFWAGRYSDNLNDREMLEFAGVPVVMGNSVAELKTNGWRVTHSNDDDGVAAAIEAYALGAA